MNPLQKNKVDIKSLSPEEQRLFRLYGKLPTRSDHFAKHLKERKYFDSGDYALSKAGKADSVDTGAIGSQHPVPEDIPHLSSPVGAANNPGNNSSNGPAASGPGPGMLHAHHQHHGSMQAGSPVKESSFLTRESSGLGQEAQAGGVPAATEDDTNEKLKEAGAAGEGIPIRH